MDLEVEAIGACTLELGKLGFRRRRAGLYIRPSCPLVDGWLGLNLATRGLPSVIEVNPVVGVRHQKLEAELLELVNNAAKPPIPSVTRPLGYLMPEGRFKTWRFVAGGDTAETAVDMALAVRDYGLTFIENYSDWGSFCMLLDEGDLLLRNQASKIRPIAHALSGDLETASQLIRAELTEVESKSDVYSRSYREFAKRFSAKYLQ